MELIKKQQTNYGVYEFLLNFDSKKTRQAYESDLKDFFEFLEGRGMLPQSPQDISGVHFIAYREWLKSLGKSVSTINRRFSTLKSLWSWFVHKNYVTSNPVDHIKLPRTYTQKATQAFTDEEVKLMINSPSRSFHGKVHKMAMMLLFYTGMRRSEVCNLKVEDLVNADGYLIARIVGKGGKLREIPLPNKLAQELSKYINRMKLSPKDYVLQSKKNQRNDKPYNATTLYKIIKRYAKRCGLNKSVSPHSCRATVITKSLESGAPVTEVADLAGHSSITTTQIYWKRREGFKSSPLNKLDY